MDGKSTNRPILDPTDVTMDAPSDFSRGATGDACANVALVEGSGPKLTCEMDAVLRRRLRIAAGTLLVGFGSFLVWSFFAWDAEKFMAVPIMVGHVAVVLILAATFGFLCKRCEFPSWKLRGFEAVVFLVPSLFFLLLQYASAPMCAETYDTIRTPAPPWLLLMFTYALFIPNSWRRASLVLGAMALAPLAMLGFLYFTDTLCATVMAGETNFLIELTLIMVLGAFSGTVGVHTIWTLRRQAYEARRMGQYRLRQLLGSGGMGEVHLAEHQMLKRPCAIKLIRPEKAGDPKVLARFEREVRATAKLSHWNTVEIFDYGHAEDGTFYYVMEFLPGMNLNDLVQQFGPLPPERVVHLLRQTCDGLREAHAANLVHRDIKPANIFAAQRGGVYDVAKLLDFGLAKPISNLEDTRLTVEGSITGSPLYMSPEQASGDSDPDARSDIYSLGAVAYFLLTGRPPFDDHRPIKLLISHAHEPPRPLTEVDSSLPADLCDVVMRCLEKDPLDRYQSAADLEAALQACTSADMWSRDQAARWWQQHPEPAQHEQLAETEPLQLAGAE